MVEERQRGSKSIHQYLLQQKSKFKLNRLSCNVVTSNVKCQCFHGPGHLTQSNPYGSKQTIIHINKFQILSTLCFATLSVFWLPWPELHWILRKPSSSPLGLCAKCKGLMVKLSLPLVKAPSTIAEPLLVDSCLSFRPTVVQDHHLDTKKNRKANL